MPAAAARENLRSAAASPHRAPGALLAARILKANVLMMRPPPAALPSICGPENHASKSPYLRGEQQACLVRGVAWRKSSSVQGPFLETVRFGNVPGQCVTTQCPRSFAPTAVVGFFGHKDPGEKKNVGPRPLLADFPPHPGPPERQPCPSRPPPSPS